MWFLVQALIVGAFVLFAQEWAAEATVGERRGVMVLFGLAGYYAALLITTALSALIDHPYKARSRKKRREEQRPSRQVALRLPQQ
jgi:uncharacterized membrane protein